MGLLKLRLTLKAPYLRYTQARLRNLKIITDIKPPVKSLSGKTLILKDLTNSLSGLELVCFNLVVNFK